MLMIQLALKCQPAKGVVVVKRVAVVRVVMAVKVVPAVVVAAAADTDKYGCELP